MNASQNLSVKVELKAVGQVRENSNGTAFRNAQVLFTDPVTAEQTLVWARIWETTLTNGAKIGDMLSARHETWTGTDGKVRETLTVFGGSDAVSASASLFSNALKKADATTADLNSKPL
jgi:hypothetical protein